MSEEDRKPTEASAPPPPPAATDAEDSDPGYEDLDDILDQFDPAAKTVTSQDAPSTAPAASGPGRPPFPSQPSNASEAEFMAQLQEELAKTMSNLGVAEGSEAKNEAADIAAMGKELDEFTAKMEKEGLQPEDLLKAILGQEGIDSSTLNEAAGLEASSSTKSGTKSAGPSGTATSTADPKGSFDETIRKTLERMQASDSSARGAAQSASEDDQDILAQLMKAMESMDQGGGSGGAGGDAGDDSDLSNLFLNMMQQLTSKELLYEPMKELDEKFPAWLEKNRATLKKEDLERYETQQNIVKDIVSKFEQPSYSDSNEKDRSFIWEKMQTMQAAGSPPEDLIQAPFPGAFGPGTGGASGAEDPLGGCPTQ